ncbi:MAG: hypothetical protein QW103_00830 [Candidatus Pacearchaeota archaeon]
MKNKSKRTNFFFKVSLSLLILIFLFFIFSFFGKDSNQNFVLSEKTECFRDSDCLILRSSCCSCEEGKNPVCVSKKEFSEFSQKLESCYINGICLDMQCSKISCRCVNNKCIGQKI